MSVHSLDDIRLYDDKFVFQGRTYSYNQITYIAAMFRSTNIKVNFVSAGSSELSAFVAVFDDGADLTLIGGGVHAPTLFRFDRTGQREAMVVRDACKEMMARSFDSRLQRYEDAYEEQSYYDLDENWKLFRDGHLDHSGTRVSLKSHTAEYRGPVIMFHSRERGLMRAFLAAAFAKPKHQLILARDPDVRFHLLDKYLLNS